MSADVKLGAHFAHPTLQVSMLVPDDWTASEVAPNHVRFFGPEHPEADEYRPTFSIAVYRPDGFGDEWFEQFCAASVERLGESYDDFMLRSIDRFPLSSLVDVHATWYDWQAGPDHRSSQLQALIAMDMFRFYLINAATRTELAERYLPVFDAMLRSIRLLPAPA